MTEVVGDREWSLPENEPEDSPERANDATIPQTSGQTGASQASSLPSDESAASRGGEDEIRREHDDEEEDIERSLHPAQLQLHHLLVKADHIQACIIRDQDTMTKEAITEVVRSFVVSCSMLFNHLESTSRSTSSQHQPMEVCMKMLEFSHQLCDRLERLLLLCDRNNVVSLDESDPNSISHFYVGSSHLGQLMIRSFRYCKLTPYLARINTGIYKRMRWNVDRLHYNLNIEGRCIDDQMETVGKTDYYFLCYEGATTTRGLGGPSPTALGMWSIGQWVHTYPDPNGDDLSDWVLCEVPQGIYNRLLVVGKVEPSSSTATDFLQRLLTHQVGN